MNKLNIKEANEHLKQLHRRVFELENQVQMHTLHMQELEKTNAELLERLKTAERESERELAAKEAQNVEIRKQLSECESRVDVLLQAAEERDRLVLRLEAKARLFYEVVEHRAALSRIVEVLDDIHRQKEAEVSRNEMSGAILNGSEKELDEQEKNGGRTVVTDNGALSTSTSDIESPDTV